MAKLVYALDSGSSGSNSLQVQVLFSAPIKRLFFLIWRPEPTAGAGHKVKVSLLQFSFVQNATRANKNLCRMINITWFWILINMNNLITFYRWLWKKTNFMYYKSITPQNEVLCFNYSPIIFIKTCLFLNPSSS